MANTYPKQFVSMCMCIRIYVLNVHVSVSVHVCAKFCMCIHIYIYTKIICKHKCQRLRKRMCGVYLFIEKMFCVYMYCMIHVHI